MLALSRKQMMVLLLVLVSFIVVLAASMMVIHATNPTMWQHFMSALPQIVSHW
jgi:uncharacterized protein (DUF983 family)